MPPEEARERVLASVVVVAGRVGLARITVEEVAAEAGVSRASVYRWFPGGRDQLVDEGITFEVARFLGRLGGAVEGADDLRACLVRGLVFAHRAIEAHEVPKGLEDKVVAGVVAAARFLEGHAALRFLLVHEPEVVLPWVAFHRMSSLYDVVAGFAAPHLERELGDPDDAARASEWLARVVLTYVAHPVSGVDLADPVAARHLLSTYVLPGLVAGTAAPKESPRVR